MRLNIEQQKTVEDNHNLIYGYIRDRCLDIEDWYGLLAIELCKTVMKYDPTKGATLGTYFYLRCDNLLRKEYAKTKTKKNANNGVYTIEDRYDIQDEVNVQDEVEFNSWFEGENGNILRMKYDGYTQSEIAEKIGVTQSFISKIIRKEYIKHGR